jgi:RND family efflux transporter MFP subunit
VVKRLVNVGEQVDGTAAQPLLEIANLDQVELAAGVPARQVSRVRVGQRVAVVSDAYPDQSFAGGVVAMAPAVDPETNTTLARISVHNPGQLLKVGMYAQARIVVGVRPKVLTVPASAIARGEAGTAVYVAANGIAQRTPVVVGLETADGVEIVSGVAEGQVVLTSAIHGLGERARLAPAS